MSLNLKSSTVGQGQNLVFLHGWGVNSGVWESVIPLLKNQFKVTCIDLPGFGQNHNKLPHTYELKDVAQYIAEHLPDNCYLIGWSLGGLVAQQIALSFPTKLQQLVLICSSPKFSQGENWPGIAPQVSQMFSEQLTHDFSKTLDRFLAIQAMGSKSARQDVKKIKRAIEQYPTPSPIALAEGLSLLDSCDLRAELTNLSVPCHAFFGRLDSLVPAKLSGSLSNLSAQITVQILPEASHAPFISHTEEFVEQLKEILL